jgi:hypothetical protein
VPPNDIHVLPEQQARNKNKAKGRIYDRLFKVHGDKEETDIIKTKLIVAYPVPLNSIINLN